MQDGGDSTSKSGEDPGSIKPEKDLDHFDMQNFESAEPQKVYDFYHQHFGVALAAGSQEVRNTEAGSRAAYSSRTEVADKHDTKSDSWHALKSLIRYQNATTPAPEQQESFSSTSSGDSFEAQWFGKSADELTSAGTTETTVAEPEAVRLQWTPIVDNVSEAAKAEYPVIFDESSIEEVAAELLPKAARPAVKIGFGKQARMARRVSARPKISEEISADADPAHTASEVQPDKDSLSASKDFKSVDSEEIQPANLVVVDDKVDDSVKEKGVVVDDAPIIGLSDMDAILELHSADSGSQSDDNEVRASEDNEVPASEDDDVSEHEVAEARSKFGSMNAFARMQKRTKEQVETKEEQSITGDIPDVVQEEVQSGNWDTKPAAEGEGAEGATVLNQWCSTSTGDSIPKVPSLDELNSIPTPSVLKDAPTQPKPFSLSTPKASAAETAEDISPNTVHQAARASWLQAASEYSSSVIKAVTEQMKSLSAKPKKTTPESPEFHTEELPEPPEDNS